LEEVLLYGFLALAGKCEKAYLKVQCLSPPQRKRSKIIKKL